jgi:ABC-2 type transport system permease protein
MSAATAIRPEFTSPFAGTKVTFPRLLVSEWRKLWSLRSTWWVLGITAALLLGVAVLFSAAFASRLSDPEVQAEVGAMVNPTTFITSGYQFATVVAATLGALAMTSEYSTGMIRATFSAAPTRLPVLWAKLAVIAIVTFVVVAVATAAAWLATYPVLSANDVAADLGDPEQLRALLGVPMFAAVVAMFAVAVGALVRSTPGAIVTIVALFFLVPAIIGSIAAVTGQAWAETLNKWLPGSAGERIITQVGDAPPVAGPGGPSATLPLFDAWPGFGVLGLYTVVLIVAAAIMIKRRDA